MRRYSPHYIRLQPVLPTVAASITYGCSLQDIWLQPAAHTVAACITTLTRCATLASLLFKCYADMKKTKREKWIKDSNLVRVRFS